MSSYPGQDVQAIMLNNDIHSILSGVSARALIESDKRLRTLERAYKASGDKESAEAYIGVAEARGETNSPVYFSAKWDTGAPRGTDIMRVGTILSDAIDTVSQAYQPPPPGVPLTSNILFLLTKYSAGFPSPMECVERAISAAWHFDRDDARKVYKWAEKLVKEIEKSKGMPTWRIKHFKRAVEAMKTLAGDE